ncbi:ribosomal protein L7/L12 [Bacillus coahuilensis]|uniref:ribosomal protein L7/L12 n=1 Tax=Bacillus coahuilensis TaxID=408580 RepID=UPI000750BCFC|nr:ribosomal protein L7/L12 [Bacillus coahuilensis]
MVLKKTLAELGLQIKQLVSSKEFYSYLIDQPLLIERLFEGITLDGLQDIEPYEGPLIKGVEKALKLKQEERYILETMKSQLEEADVLFTERDIKLSMIHQYLKHTAYLDSSYQMELFDFVVELLVDLKMVNEADGSNEDSGVYPEEEVEVERIYDVVLFSHGEDKFQLIKDIKKVLSIELKAAHELVSNLPAPLLVKGTREEADAVLAVAKNHGAVAFGKTEIEKFHTVVAPVAGELLLKDEPNRFVSPFFRNGRTNLECLPIRLITTGAMGLRI